MATNSTHRDNLFGGLRKLAPWRSRTRLGRATAVLVSLLMTLLMLGATGPVYAEDAAPTDPASTTETTPADPPPPDTSGTSTGTTTTDPTTPTTPTDTTVTDTTKKAAAKTTTATTSLASVAITVAQALITPITNTGGFEIDGDTEVNNGGDDWANYPPLASEGYRDAQGYKGNNKQDDDPSGWNGAQVATEKMDMVKLWVKTLAPGPRGVFGIQRDAANGTTAYFFEYNQRENLAGDVAKPDRRPNDVMFAYTQSGNTGPGGDNKLSFEQGYVYALTSSSAWSAGNCTAINNSVPAGGWCKLGTSGGVFYGATSNGTGTYGEGIFAEGVVDFSKLNFPAGTCRGALGTLNVRSQASLSWTSAMQDFAVADVSIPPTCGSLTIEKKGLTGDTLIPGAIYSIVDDPRPGQTGTYTVFDGTAAQMAALSPAAPAGTVADGAGDGSVSINPAEPDTYTVTELRAPAGYFLPSSVSQQVTVGAAGSENQNVTIAFRDPKKWDDLTVQKTATASYSASYAWSIDKQVANSANGPWTDTGAGTDSEQINNAAGSGTFYYRVAVTQGAKTPSNYQVNGNIRVKNPNTSAVTVNLSDSLPGATCSVTGTTTPSVPGDNAFHDYPYSCSFAGTPTAGQLTGNNSATVTWSKSDYPQVQGDVGGSGNYSKTPSAGYDFTAAAAETSSTNKSVNVTDNKHSFTPNPYVITWSAQGTVTNLDYSRVITAGSGTCTTDNNTATLKSQDAGNATLGTDTASAKVCRGADLVVTKGATASLVRTYPWSISKSTTTPRIDVGSDGKATASYEVTVTAGDKVDSEWHMSGSINVQNPNDWEGIDVSSITDVYSGGGTCSITGVKSGASFIAVSFPYTIPASTTKEFSYDCAFAGQPSTYTGTNTATANWAGGATPGTSAQGTYTLKNVDTQTALSGTNDWAKTLVNSSVTVYDDHATPGNAADDTSYPLTWSTVYGMTGHATKLTYTIDLAVPTAGTCANRVNTVKVVGTNGAILDADNNSANNSATVRVCNPLTLTGTKTATPSFTRTYDWAVLKEVRVSPDGAWQDDTATFTGDTFSHDFDYRLTVSRDGSVDSAWKMTGTITVTNPNTDSDIAPITATVSEPGTIGGATATCVIDDNDPLTPNTSSASVTVASGTHVDLAYVCNLSGAPQAGSSNVATIAWGQAQGQSTNATSSPVTFSTPTTKVNDSVTVRDDVATISMADDKTFGPLTWAEASSPVVYGPYTLTHTATKTGCDAANNATNTATVYGDGNAVLDTDQATAAICPNPGAWTIAKSSPNDGQEVPVGSTVNFALTAHKTGGVNPTGVVITDDLTDVVAHTGIPSLPLPAAMPAGQTATYNVATHILTWTIAELGAADQTLNYSVVVNANAWNVTFRNVATSAGSTNCPAPATAGDECRTVHSTPEQPKLTLVKQVTNTGTDGTATPADWTVTAKNAQAQTVMSHSSTTSGSVDPGTYDLSEAPTTPPGPVGYTSDGVWSCDNNKTEAVETTYRRVQGDPDSVALQPNDDVSCTITNVAQRQAWTLAKSSTPSGDPLLPTDGTITYSLTVTHTTGVIPTASWSRTTSPPCSTTRRWCLTASSSTASLLLRVTSASSATS